MSSEAKSANRAAEESDRSKEAPNPKLAPDAPGNRLKDPEEWVTGREPMTEAQASYLKTLSEQAHDPGAFDPELDKAAASKRIDQLKRSRED